MSYLHSAARLVDYKPLIMLKFLLKSGQKEGWEEDEMTS